MLFNSVSFAIFFPIVFIIYWFVVRKNLFLQNFFLLVSSYIFYAFWDWRFLFLLFSVSLINFTVGLLIFQSNFIKNKKLLLLIGLILNIGVLAYFKYFNFFIQSFIDMFSLLGFSLHNSTLNIILPLGISFYIFLSISYIIDIYKNRIKTQHNIVEVLLSLSFFPIILAGPIQRPVDLLLQIGKERVFDNKFASIGLRQILWGLFMKVVIADRCAIIVNDVFNNIDMFNGSTLFLGGLFYTIQIYADFAGYSLVAIGVSRLLGFDLMRNFAYPYFSRDITEFWKRWHISLTTWFRDYVFLPIAFSVSKRIPAESIWKIKTDIVIYIIGITVTWLLTGMWHGANYTFLIWGLLNGLLLINYQILRKPRKKFLKAINVSNNNFFLKSFEWLFTMFFVVISWIIFRSDSFEVARNYISKVFTSSLLSSPTFNLTKDNLAITASLVIFFMSIEWLGRNSQFAICNIDTKLNRPFRWLFYSFIIFLIGSYMPTEQSPFIYFQF